MRTGSSLLGVTALALTLVTSLAACNGVGAGYGPGEPPGPGGHSGGSIGDDDDTADAGTVIGADGSIANGVNGYACAVGDVRAPGSCTRLGLVGLLVRLEDTGHHVLGTTMTTAGGSFSFERPTDVLAVFVTVDDPAHLYHLSAQRASIAVGQETQVIVPIITQAYYDAILAASGVPDEAGKAQVFLHLLHGETPVADAIIGPLAGVNAYYDSVGDDKTFTPQTPTTENGFAAWFNVPPSALLLNYNVTLGATVTPHNGFAYDDAVVFLSDVN